MAPGRCNSSNKIWKLSLFFTKLYSATFPLGKTNSEVSVSGKIQKKMDPRWKFVKIPFFDTFLDYVCVPIAKIISKGQFYHSLLQSFFEQGEAHSGKNFRQSLIRSTEASRHVVSVDKKSFLHMHNNIKLRKKIVKDMICSRKSEEDSLKISKSTK